MTNRCTQHLGMILLAFLLMACPGRGDTGAARSGSEDMMGSGNRLQFEKSPYLLQHKNNPVDWYPWGDEAFARAKELDRPIFLSIGYATCHWCHVMEHESFEDSTVAAVLNDHFVSIKVDREERPDIDDIYMNVCQMMTRGGGWPLTIIMTPDARPFFAGTYIPKTPRYGRTGLIDLLNTITKKWTGDRANVTAIGDRVTDALKQMSDDLSGKTPGYSALENAINQMKSQFDRTYGGFGGAPKFPMPHRLTGAIRWVSRTADQDLLDQLSATMRAMRRGGIYDQLGFGFHRYSTDAQWLVPHFEKMLYDNAGMAIAYTEMFQLTGSDEWRQTAEEIFTYVRRDMTAPGGGFYSAEDADSEGEEGTFYVWTPSEISKILSPDLARVATGFWGATPRGNFEGGRTIFAISRSLEEYAAETGESVEVVRAQLEEARQILFDEREKRIHPLKDDKVLTSWNGFMIAALAKGAQAFDKPEYAELAARAADFVLENMRGKNGRLLRRYRDGDANILGYCEDYAFLVWGLIELYEATFETRYLEEALALSEQMLELFWDDERGGLYSTGTDAEELLIRPKEYGDGALPSGNSVAALNLMRLARMTGNVAMEEKASKLLESFGARFVQSPIGFMQAWWAVDFAVGPSQEIVIAGAKGDGTRELLRAIRGTYLPRKVVIAVSGDDDRIARLAPFVKSMGPVNGKSAVYVCRNYQCDLPVTSVEALGTLLAKSGDAK